MKTCPRCGASDASGRLEVCPTCLLVAVGAGVGAAGAALADLEDEPLPVLGPTWLHVQRELGRGGMGSVLLAHDERLGRDVAVKVLRPEGALDPEFRARFAREARTLARLEHPGIVALYDFGTTPGGESYLVMQLVSGGSLADRLPLAVADAVDVVRQLCDALAYAHARGVVHRDIKPENVLVGEDGRARLSDFGVARLVNRAADGGFLTSSSVVFGTPGYVAPEALAGADPDPRMDVYAAGALLAHLITGQHPGRRGPAAGEVRERLPLSLAPLVARATAPDLTLRTPSAEALRRELDVVALQQSAARGASIDDLPPEERTWRGAVALLAAVATAVTLYALLVSFTPRSVAIDDVLPLTAFGNEPLADGRVLTRARFEVGPTLGAAVAIALALLAHGLLRRHWRLAGFDRPTPERRLAGSARVLVIGGVLFALFLAREALARAGVSGAITYLPVLGGCLELVMLHRFWDAALEAQQTGRALAREPLLWLGVVLALFPPAYHVALLIF